MYKLKDISTPKMLLGTINKVNTQSPNLLINGDFAINQRGESSYSTNAGFGPDRWQLLKNGNAYYDVATKSIHCGTTGTYIWLRQKVEIDITTLIGKTLTFSVRLKASTNSYISIGYYRDSTFVALSENVARSEDSEFRTVTVSTIVPTTVISTDILTVRAYCNITNSSLAFEWMKLEVGSIATPFVPPLIAEELPKCQRYYQKIMATGGAANAFVYGVLRTTTDARFSIPLSSTLRTTPTIVSSGLRVFNFVTATEYTPDGTITIGSVNNNNIFIQIAHSASMGTAGASMQMYGAGATNYISFDAEIY